MKITEPGRYRLLSDMTTTDAIGIGTISAGTVLHITQVDSRFRKVIGHPLMDWHTNEMDVVREDGLPLRPCCGRTPKENGCSLRGRMWFEVACPKCRKRTGALGCRHSACLMWNKHRGPAPHAQWNYEVQDTKNGWEYEFVKKPISTTRR